MQCIWKRTETFVIRRSLERYGRPSGIRSKRNYSSFWLPPEVPCLALCRYLRRYLRFYATKTSTLLRSCFE